MAPRSSSTRRVRVRTARSALRRYDPHPDTAARPHPRRRRRQGRRPARHRPGLPGHQRRRPGRRADARYLIRCNEAWARYEPGQLAGTDSFEYEHIRKDAEWWQSVCASSPRPATTAAAAAQARSDVPVLALNGEADPQDPPANMASASAVWPNSLRWSCPGKGTTSTPHRRRAHPAHPGVHRPGCRDRPRHHLPIATPTAAFDLRLPNA